MNAQNIKNKMESERLKKRYNRARFFLVLSLALTIFFVLVVNPYGSTFITSVGNQEVFTYHMRDLFGISSEPAEEDGYYLSTGTYENQLSGELYGVAKGRNLIVLQVESLQTLVIGKTYNGQEIMPNLNAMINNDSVYFDHYYQQLGSGNTSDSEYATNNSLLGSIKSYTYKIYKDDYFKGLPWLLKEKGYTTAAFHGYDKTFWNREEAYKGQGFDTFVNSDYFQNDNLIGKGEQVMGISDKAFFQQSMPKLKELSQPFYSFMITLSNHHPFQLPAEMQKIQLKESDKGSLLGNYLNSVHYVDEAIGEFVEELKKEGLYDNSVIVIYGDHLGLPQTDETVKKSVSAFLGREYTLDKAMNIPLVIHIPGMEPEARTISVTGGETDFLPTIAYIMGFETLNTLYIGQNLINAESGIVPEQTYLLKGSFITDDVVFEMSRDGVFSHSKAWSVKTGEAVPIDGLEETSLKMRQLVEMCQFYLDHDVLRLSLIEGLSMQEILSGIEKSNFFPKQVADRQNATGGVTISQDLYLNKQYDSGYRYLTGEVTVQDGNNQYTFDKNTLLMWMQAHEDATLFVSSQGDILEFSQKFATEKEAAGIIPLIDDMKDYTKLQYAGYDHIAFEADYNKYSEVQVEEFVQIYKPWAVVLSYEDSQTKGKPLLLKYLDTGFYIRGETSESLEELSQKGIAGVISEDLPEDGGQIPPSDGMGQNLQEDSIVVKLSNGQNPLISTGVLSVLGVVFLGWGLYLNRLKKMVKILQS